MFRMIPGTYADPPPPEKGYVLTALRDAVFHYSDDAYHALIIFEVKRRHLVLVDFPKSANSFGTDGSYRLVTAIKEVMSGVHPRRVDMVYSHRHLDHIGSARIVYRFIRTNFPSAWMRVLATPQAAQFLKLNEAANVPLPTTLVSHLGVNVRLSPSLIVRLFPLSAHTNSDLVLHVLPTRHGSSDGVIHLVDVVSVGEVPFTAFTLTTDLSAYLRAHRAILRLPFTTISTGHGKLGKRKDVSVSLRFALSVIASLRAAAESLTLRQLGGIFGRIANPDDAAFRNGAWALDSVLQLQIRQCVRDMIQMWGCTLSVVDVFAESHCKAAALYFLVDQ